MNSSEPFPYTGQSRKYIPRDVTHVKVDPSVKVIGDEAFMGRRKLRSAAFQGCTLLERIIIPSTVKVIGRYAFYCCAQLRNVELCEGLERIHWEAFQGCTSLERINIPSTVKAIGVTAFLDCSQFGSS